VRIGVTSAPSASILMSRNSLPSCLMNHQSGRWLKVRLDLHAPDRQVHLRGVHDLQAMKSDGTPNQNKRTTTNR
jgi:hypothetical protein